MNDLISYCREPGFDNPNMSTHDLTVLNDPEAQWAFLRSRALPEHRDALTTAYQLACRVHEGQTRKTADKKPVPYMVHPLRVARILSEERSEEHTSELQLHSF